LKLAVEARGSLARWNRIAAVEAHLPIAGASGTLSLKLGDDQVIMPNLSHIPMANEPDQTTTNEPKEQSPQTDRGSRPSYDAFVLTAYFIALDRHARGEAPDPLKDWLEAERQLARAV
jgi:hypothetical protein